MSVFIEGTIPTPNNPRIIWDKIAGEVAASSEDALYEAILADQPQTYTAWRPEAVPATWSITPVSPVPVDSCAIGCHNLGSSGATVFVEYFDGADWIEAATATPTDDSAILFLFAEVAAADAWRIRITGAIAEIGVIMFASAMVFPKGAQFAPGLPITEAEQYEYNVNKTDGGDWAGRSLISNGLQFSVTINNLSETFAAGDWAEFRRHANEGDATFFIAPKPLAYPKEVAYAWSNETIRASRNTPNKAITRSVDLNCQGYREL